jgi:hypothetical protein
MTVVTDVNQYDPATIAWSSMPPVEVARYRAAATVVFDMFDHVLSFVGGSTAFDWYTVTPTTAAEGLLLP